MKTTLLFLGIFFTGISYSQISVSQLIKIAKMDMESFEIYAMEQGYVLNEAVDDKFYGKGLSFVKYDGHRDVTRYLASYSEYFSAKYHSGYASEDINFELPNIYRSLKELGFKLENTEYNKNLADIVKTYIKGEEEIKIYITKEDFEMGYTVR